MISTCYCVIILKFGYAFEVFGAFSAYSVEVKRNSSWWLLTLFLLETVRQRIYSRAPNFDNSPNQILTVEDMVTQIRPPGLWLSVPVQMNSS